MECQTYQNIDDRASKLGLGTLCFDILKIIQAGLPDERDYKNRKKSKTLKNAIAVFEKWWDLRGPLDIERDAPGHVLLKLLRNKLEEKEARVK